MKWSGYIGYAVEKETATDIIEYSITKFKAKGNMKQITKRTQSSEGVVDGISLNNELELIASPFINKILYSIKYVDFMNVPWKVTNVRVNYPKIFLTLGDVYNGPKG